jgi:hypothetical protein
MKNTSRNCMGIAIAAVLTGFAVESQAITVFSENYESYAAGQNEFSWGDTGNVTPVNSPYYVSIQPGAGVGGSQALVYEDTFHNQWNGYVANQIGYSGGNPSGNTSANLSDYTLSFQMAIWNGVGLGHLQVDLQGWAGEWFTGAFTETGAKTIDTSSVTVGGGFQTISVNLGTWAAGSGFDPTSQTYQPQLQVNGWELAGGGPVTDETIAIDNLQVTMVAVPEPSTLALIGLGAASLLALRRRNS